MSNYGKKLEIDDSIDFRITDCMYSATVVEELESFLVDP